jgi:hypothetical protein
MLELIAYYQSQKEKNYIQLIEYTRKSLKIEQISGEEDYLSKYHITKKKNSLHVQILLIQTYFETLKLDLNVIDASIHVSYEKYDSNIEILCSKWFEVRLKNQPMQEIDNRILEHSNWLWRESLMKLNEQR